VWRLGEEGACEEFGCMVGDRVEEVGWKGLGVGDHWRRMGGVMMEAAQDMCGMAGGPPRHRETWWWSEEVAEAVGNGKVKCGRWGRENTGEAGMECGEWTGCEESCLFGEGEETEGMGKRLE